MNSFFTVTCNSTFSQLQPLHVATMMGNYTGGFNLVGTPFILSTTRNRFMVIGCNTMGLSVSTVVVIALACIVGYENSKKKAQEGEGTVL
jgi:hypothetical protein